ncbi:hypothetical protein BREVNS_0909 [Brevinematales bacterium NS]|nr:hypothetical protein BREVNS_0909 [Brevinematales bacterium NS]
MKRNLFALLSLLFLFACSQPMAYYQSVGFDERYVIVGENPLKKPLTNQGFYTIWYDHQKRPVKICYGLTNTLLPDPAFGVEQILFEYSPTNEKRLFLDASNHLKVSPQQGYAIAILDYNEKGQAVQVRYYDTNFSPAFDQRKAFRYEWRRDEKNRITKVTGYDTHGQVVSFMGIASVEWTYDRQGNLIEQRYYDASGNLTSKTFWGYAIEKRSYDRKKRLIEQAFYDETGRPVNYNFWHIHKYRYFYDRKGRLTNTIRYMVTNGEIVQVAR